MRSGRQWAHQLSQTPKRALSAKGSGSLVLFLFDLLYLDGQDLRHSPLQDRKAALASLLGASKRKRLVYVDSLRGDGPEFFRQCCESGLEGIVSKWATAPYRSGRDDWHKCKCNVEEVLVIGGFTYGRTKSVLGELLMGRRKGRALNYVGRVAFGLAGEAKNVLAILQKMRQNECPFADKKPRDGQCVRPRLKAEVEYSTQSKPGQLRHAVFRGIAN
jgi:bifunctional non-homologous end joining protein LigD